MWVVKIGGSLERSSALPAWLDVATGAGAGRVVVVPGGGSFAEAVRASDAHWGIPSPVAHRMAILAMEQFAELMCGLNGNLVRAESETMIRDALRRGRTPVWMAAAMSLAAADEVAASWRVTSDSLAAWLAAKLGATLVLVKAAAKPATGDSIAVLCRAGFLDPAFSDYAHALECEIFCLGPDEHPRLAEALEFGKTPGRPLKP